MIKKICILGCAVLVSIGSMAQSLFKLEPDENAFFGGISGNGRWAYGAEQQSGAYLYDLSNRQLFIYEKAYVDGVSDNGILVGDNSSGAAYCRNNSWYILPLPEKSGITESEARGVSKDGSLIVGDISYAKGPRKPCLWTRQADGSYNFEYLPTIEKDITERTPQAVDALRCSATGEMIFGRLVDWSGMFCLPVFWKKESSGQWSVHLSGKEIMIREGATVPSIPNVDTPDPSEYFSKQDSITFQHVVDEWKKNPGSQINPEWGDLSVYITNPDSIAAYKKDLEAYKKIEVVIKAKTAEFYEVLSGKTFDAYTLSMSANGRYLATTCNETDMDATSEDDEYVITYPIVYDIHVGQWETKPVSKDCIVQGITDNGDLFYASPYMEDTRNSFVIPAGSEEALPISHWIYEQTEGKLDVSRNPDFLFDYDYTNAEGQHIVVNDSLVLGTVFPSSDGRILLGTFYSPATGEPITFFVDMDNAYISSVNETQANKEALFYPNPVCDELYLNKEIEKIEFFDIAGRLVYKSGVVSGTIPMNRFENGTYLVKITADGKQTSHKVVVSHT